MFVVEKLNRPVTTRPHSVSVTHVSCPEWRRSIWAAPDGCWTPGKWTPCSGDGVPGVPGAARSSLSGPVAFRTSRRSERSPATTWPAAADVLQTKTSANVQWRQRSPGTLRLNRPVRADRVDTMFPAGLINKYLYDKLSPLQSPTHQPSLFLQRTVVPRPFQLCGPPISIQKNFKAPTC